VVFCEISDVGDEFFRAWASPLNASAPFGGVFRFFLAYDRSISNRRDARLAGFHFVGGLTMAMPPSFKRPPFWHRSFSPSMAHFPFNYSIVNRVWTVVLAFFFLCPGKSCPLVCSPILNFFKVLGYDFHIPVRRRFCLHNDLCLQRELFFDGDRLFPFTPFPFPPRLLFHRASQFQKVGRSCWGRASAPETVISSPPPPPPLFLPDSHSRVFLVIWPFFSRMRSLEGSALFKPRLSSSSRCPPSPCLSAPPYLFSF